MRILILILLLLTTFSVNAQRSIPKTDSLLIVGQIKNPTTFSLSDLDTFPKSVIKDQIIYNHNGEAKDTLTGMKGIPLKSLLATIQYIYEKPKFLNEFYFVFIASDGYKVVFSWNEIYNSEAGNSLFLITEMQGVQLSNLDQRLLFISTADLKAGRRYIKGLEKIDVKSVE